MRNKALSVIYWDSSAVLSALFKDNHSEVALERSRASGIHLISTLTIAETHAVIRRISRERLLADILIEAAIEALETGPWRRLNIGPDSSEIKTLSQKWSLRGADLWHLATTKTLQKELPKLKMLTFDNKLLLAATSEGLIRNT